MGVTGSQGTGKKKNTKDTLATKMNPDNMKQTGQGYVGENQPRIVSTLRRQRRLPSVHLYSQLLQGSLDKWEHVYNEKLAVEYLGPCYEATSAITTTTSSKPTTTTSTFYV